MINAFYPFFARGVRHVSILRICMAACCALVSFSVHPEHVVEGSNLTEYEWQTWPEWCKAGFIASEWARESRFKERMSAPTVKSVREAYYRNYGISGPHHICLAMVYLNRAKALPVGGEFGPRSNYIKKAINEIQYSYSRTQKTAGGYSLLAAYRGTAFFLDGKRVDAIKAWEEGIRLQPAKKESYLAWAQALISEKTFEKALEVLNLYDEAKEKSSADGEYFLGFTLYELGRIEEARPHIERAHELGYPFTGLKEKLEKVGGRPPAGN